MKKSCAFLFLFAWLTLFPSVAAAVPACNHNFGSDLLNAVADRQYDDVLTLLAQPMSKEDRQTTLANALMLTLSGRSTSCAKTSHDVELFRILIKSGANVNTHVRINATETTFLMRAAQDGDTQMASAALATDAKINETTRNSTALIEATRSGNPKMVELLLNSGADPNLVVGEDSQRTTALIQATRSGNPKMVELLLNSGADPNLEVDEGSNHASALIAAARSPGRANAVLKLLIQHGLQNKLHGTSAIKEFATNYQGADEDAQECLKLLLILHSDFNANGELTTALLSSIQHSYSGTAVIEALLGRGATADWRAVLALANRREGRNSKASRARVFEVLLRYGLDQDQTTPSGRHWLEVLTPTEPLEKKLFLEELTTILGSERR